MNTQFLQEITFESQNSGIQISQNEEKAISLDERRSNCFTMIRNLDQSPRKNNSQAQSNLAIARALLTRNTTGEIIETIEPFSGKFRVGGWKNDESDKFMEALKRYGKDWYKIQAYVQTRDHQHIRSHSQKFHAKLKLCIEKGCRPDMCEFDKRKNGENCQFFHNILKQEVVRDPPKRRHPRTKTLGRPKNISKTIKKEESPKIKYMKRDNKPIFKRRLNALAILRNNSQLSYTGTNWLTHMRQLR